jgi:hypothetical protein
MKKRTLKLILLFLAIATPFILRGCFFFYQGRYGKLALQEDCDKDTSECTVVDEKYVQK